MVSPITKFFNENAVDSGDKRFHDVQNQRNVFASIAVLFNASDADVDIVGSHVAQSVRLPTVRFFLSGGTQCVIRGNFEDYAVTVFGSAPLDPQKLRDLGIGAEKLDAGACDGFPQDLIFDTFEADTVKFTTRVKNNDGSMRLWRFLQYVKTANSPERRLSHNTLREGDVLKA